MRTRSCKVVSPRRNKNINYTNVLLPLGFKQTLTQTCTLDCLYFSTLDYSYSNLDCFFEPYSLITDFAYAPLRGHANIETMPLVQEP